MKKILLFITAFLFFVFPVFSQFDDIQPDQVRVDQFVDNETTNYTEITGEHIESFDSNIIINKDGTIDVKETIVYDFDNLQKHGIYREIPFIKTNQDGKKYRLEINNISVVDENGSNYQYQILKENNNIRLKIGDPNRTITGEHSYLISYKVSGALTYFSDHDELYWNVTGNEWTVPIANTTASVVWPQEIKKEDIKSICYTGVFGSKESFCQVVLPSLNDRAKMVITSNGSLGNGEGLTIVVSFPKNIVAVLEPKEFDSFWGTFAGKLVMGLIGLIGLIWYVFLPFYSCHQSGP